MTKKASPTLTIPPSFAKSGWYTAAFVSKKLNIPKRTILNWCENGFFSRRGVPVILIPQTGLMGNRSSYWLYIPKAKFSTDAMLKKFDLDIILPSNVTSPCIIGLVGEAVGRTGNNEGASAGG